MYTIDSYIEPTSLDEAVQYLKEKPETKLIAGGTDVLLRLAEDRLAPVSLMSLSKISDLSGIRQEGDSLFLGPMVTFSEIQNSKLVQDVCDVLKTAADSVAGPQIRNVATVGGNICNGAPSADSAPSLLALDARLHIIGPQGARISSVEDFYLGPKKVDIRPGEILRAIEIPLADRSCCNAHYIKYSLRKTMDISTLGCAVVVTMDQKGQVEKMRIALGTAAPTPMRCKEAENYAIGKKLTPDIMKEIGDLAAKEAKPRTSWRAAADFRTYLVRVLSQKAIGIAVSKIG